MDVASKQSGTVKPQSKTILNERENVLILSRDLCRLSTINQNGWPHSVPVSYMYRQDNLYIPSAPHTRKIRNLRTNARATVVIDDENLEHGLMIECESKILSGARAQPFKKYMRDVKGWKNDETTIVVELVPRRKVSWFLK